MKENTFPWLLMPNKTFQSIKEIKDFYFYFLYLNAHKEKKEKYQLVKTKKNF
jgi:hypothetical protein